MKNKKLIISWLLVIIWMLVIFYLSSMNTIESNDKSKSTINKFLETTIETTNKIGLTDKHPSEQVKDKVTNELNGPLRKVMHASMYLVLTLLLINAFRFTDIKLSKALVLSILISFLYACCDEYHQTFVMGRTGKFSDVLIDTSGSILGSVGYITVYFVCKKSIKKEKNCKL